MVLERYSSKNGRASWNGTLIGNVTNIQISKSAQMDEGATSSTGGQIDRTVGHKDTTGSFTMQEKPTFDEGDKATLLLQYNSGQNAYNGHAVIISIDETIAIAEGTRIEWQVQFGQAVNSETSSSAA